MQMVQIRFRNSVNSADKDSIDTVNSANQVSK